MRIDDGGQRGHVLDDDGPGPDDGLAPQRDLGDHGRTDADEHPRLDFDAPGDAYARADVAAFADHGLVVDEAAGVQDHGVADLAVCADDHARGDNDVSPERGVVGERGGRVHGVEHGQP